MFFIPCDRFRPTYARTAVFSTWVAIPIILGIALPPLGVLWVVMITLFSMLWSALLTIPLANVFVLPLGVLTFYGLWGILFLGMLWYSARK